MKTYIQIGTNNGNDNFKQLVIKDKPNKVILVEPNLSLIPSIKNNYKNIPNVFIINKAIYYKNDEKVELVIPSKNEIYGERADNGIIYNNGHFSLLPMNDWGDKKDMVKISATTITFDTLCSNFNIKEIEYLQIDTEGFDSEIIRMIDLDKYKIKKIRYEKWNFDSSKFKKYHSDISDRLGKNGMENVKNKLQKYNYTLYNIRDQYGNDILAILNRTTKISVAIPHYNNSHYILDTLNPLITDERISEIIICDDKSKDLEKLKYILNELKCNKIKLYENKTNLGCYHNKINAISKCTNEWAILLDSDNIYYKKSIDVIYTIKNWDPNIIYAPSNAITFPGNPSKNLNYEKYNNIKITKEIFLKNFNNINFQCLINTCNYFVNVKKYYNCMKDIQYTYKRDIIDSLDSAVLFTDWLKNNNNFLIVKNLNYNHRLHTTSNYMISKAKKHENDVKKMLYNKITNS